MSSIITIRGIFFIITTICRYTMSVVVVECVYLSSERCSMWQWQKTPWSGDGSKSHFLFYRVRTYNLLGKVCCTLPSAILVCVWPNNNYIYGAPSLVRVLPLITFYCYSSHGNGAVEIGNISESCVWWKPYLLFKCTGGKKVVFADHVFLAAGDFFSSVRQSKQKSVKWLPVQLYVPLLQTVSKISPVALFPFHAYLHNLVYLGNLEIK